MSHSIITSQKITKPHFFDLTSLYNIHISAHTPFNSAPVVPQKKASAQKIKRVNVEKLISTSMSYSYAETQFGFYLENSSLFTNKPKGVVERSILNKLPTSLAKKAKKYLRAVLILSEKHQVDPLWVLSVMWTESHFNPTAQSIVGARGLMQIMPKTKSYLYHSLIKKGHKLTVEEDHFNINQFFPYRVMPNQMESHTAKLINIELGIIYLRQLLNYFKNHRYATVAYNMGPGWTRHRLRNKLPVGTKNVYLTKVQKAYKHLSQKI
tara:strand:- start:6996 stop:7793 length:798 start_codon:yes stop_codon:yes gene_type:complete